jgi:hypothetical protein
LGLQQVPAYVVPCHNSWVAEQFLPREVQIKAHISLKDGLGMKISAQWLRVAIAALVATSFSALKPALADTYTIYNLGSDQGYNMVGLTASGAAVIYNDSCVFTGTSCFTTYVNGVLVNQSTTAPTLFYDDGGACTSLPTGFDINRAVCNNGRIGFGTFYDSTTGLGAAVYTGPDSSPAFLFPGTLDGAFLNSSGDLLWNDGQTNDFFEAIDTSSSPVPEQSTLLLLVTGLVALTTLIRRKVKL